ncbi:hypothetical protein Tco_1248402 [Tanacetum coccineum]
MLNQHHSEMHEQFSQILETIGKSQTPTPKPNAPTFAITTRSGTTTRNPPYPTPSNLTTVDNTNRTIEEEGLKDKETATIQNKETPGRLPYTTPLNHPVCLSLPGHDPYAKGGQVLEMDDDEPVPIILGRPFLTTARTVIDVHEGKLSLRVKNETITFNIGKSMISSYSHNDYLYCADPTEKLIQEQCVDTVNHDRKWIKTEEKHNLEEILALELKELPEYLEYAFLQGDDQLPVVISSALSSYKKTKLLKVLKNHKEAIAWSITDIKGIDSPFCTHKILMEDEFK